MYRVFIFALTFLAAVCARAEGLYQIDCSAIESGASFSIKGGMKQVSKKEFSGNAHSFKVNKKFGSIEGCRIPWYEKFLISGNYDVKLYYHEHEYSEGCILRFVFSKGDLEGRLWVYEKGKPSNKGAVAKASCSVYQER